MAEGGEFGYDDPYADHGIDDDEQEVNWTQPFQPGAASIPYHGGEQVVQTMRHEQTGLPDTSYEEETPFLEEPVQSPIFETKAYCVKNSKNL